MTPLNLSHNDLQRLDNAAIDRFYEVYPVPDRAAILLELNNELMIAVNQPSHVDDLIDDRELLEQMAYLVFGTTDIAIWFSGIEVWRSKANDVISEVSTLPMKNMSAAILDRPTETATVAVDSVTPIDSLALEMATITGRPIDEWRSLILNSSPALFVSTTAAETLLDQQIEQLQAMKVRLKSSNSQPQPNGKTPAAEKPAAQKSPARKSRAKKPAAT